MSTTRFGSGLADDDSGEPPWSRAKRLKASSDLDSESEVENIVEIIADGKQGFATSLSSVSLCRVCDHV